MHFDTTLLEFDKVKEMILQKAHTTFGKHLAQEIKPTNNRLEIARKLGETDHALRIINGYQEPPFGGLRDLRETLQLAKIYSTLRPTAFLDIVGLLDGIHNNKRFYKQVKENEIPGEELDSYYEQLTTVPYLKQKIEQVISIDGRIYDTASSDLHKIRNKINRLHNKVNDRLNSILDREKNKLAEQLITLRGGRFVVPVKVSEKNNFKGTIIDYSSSGETIYFEPDSVTQINNEISTLKMEEEREIERILQALTAEVAEHHDALMYNFTILSELDVIFAKAKFAVIYECTMPEITETEINLIKARHPLISQEEVVANTITFNKGERIIVITGPNTGGKTVTLKTMGLLSLMVQSGMLIPVHEESKTVIFENIFADIGDEQSIEQSLSTFSSHMTRIINIVKNLSVGSLILLDELGSGTDPKEGASLAISILDFIRVRGVYVIATTHYPELKAYAYNKEEIINASVEFNVDNLRPTYRLLLGTPGKSNALLISERLGLDQRIIDHAKENVLTSKSEVADLINKLEKQGNVLDQKLQEYEQLISQTKEMVTENERLRKDLMEEKKKLKRRISVEQSQLIQETKEQALKLIKEIEAAKKASEIKEHEIASLKHKMKSLHFEEETTSSTLDHTYQAGDIVNILKFNRNAELIKQQKNGHWIVKMGTLTSQFSEDQFEFVQKKEVKPLEGRVKSKVKKRVKGELDLRGLRYDEAKHELDKYIDDCLISNMPFASIIHGFGTLTLRKLVKSYLDAHPHITRHRDGEGNEGGKGVTIVYFK